MSDTLEKQALIDEITVYREQLYKLRGSVGNLPTSDDLLAHDIPRLIHIADRLKSCLKAIGSVRQG